MMIVRYAVLVVILSALYGVFRMLTAGNEQVDSDTLLGRWILLAGAASLVLAVIAGSTAKAVVAVLVFLAFILGVSFALFLFAAVFIMAGDAARQIERKRKPKRKRKRKNEWT
jgi:hypothetical protein